MTTKIKMVLEGRSRRTEEAVLEAATQVTAAGGKVLNITYVPELPTSRWVVFFEYNWEDNMVWHEIKSIDRGVDYE